MEPVAPVLAVALSTVIEDLPVPRELAGPDRVPAVAAKGAREALSRGETHYTDRPGIRVLREAVATRLRAGGLEVDPDHVLITCGVEEARFVVTQGLMARGGTAAASMPDSVGGAVVAQGGTMVALGEPADLVFVGAVAPHSEDVSSSVGEGGWLILEAPDASLSKPLDRRLSERTVVVGDLGAASGLLSLRVGFLACSAAAYEELRDLKQALTICTTNLSQWAAHAWLEER